MALRVNLLPPGEGPYTSWQLVVEADGRVLASGDVPVNSDAVRAATEAYWRDQA